jgi:hypothetical protein
MNPKYIGKFSLFSGPFRQSVYTSHNYRGEYFCQIKYNTSTGKTHQCLYAVCDSQVISVQHFGTAPSLSGRGGDNNAYAVVIWYGVRSTRMST